MPLHTLSSDAALTGPLLEDLALLADHRLETRSDQRGRLRYRVAGLAMAWCNSVAEAIKVASILQRTPRLGA